jgi:hypothetical protein
MVKKNRSNANKATKAVPKIAGKGGYYTDRILPVARRLIPDGTFANAGNFLGSNAGRMLGAGIGASGPAGFVGGKLGKGLGSAISRLVGFGDYTVLSNTLFKESMALPPGEAVPNFGVLGHATRVRHREFVTDVYVPAVPANFVNLPFTVNPGDSYTFPWLARLARQYQQYKFEGLVFEFKTLSSDITAGGALGAVIMASNYDVVQPLFPDKLHMENSQYAVSAKPSCSQIHTMECAPEATANKLYYVRSDGIPESPSQDNRFYDLAKFQLATSGLPGTAGTVLGELWVSYDVSLYKPLIDDSIVGGVVIGSGSGAGSGPTSVFGPVPFDTRGHLISAANNRVVFNQIGEFLVELQMIGTGLSAPTITGTAPGYGLLASSNSGTTNVMFIYKAKITVPGQYLNIDASASATTITSSSIRAAPYEYDLD